MRDEELRQEHRTVELHKDGTPMCNGCDENPPCTTIRLLDRIATLTAQLERADAQETLYRLAIEHTWEYLTGNGWEYKTDVNMPGWIRLNPRWWGDRVSAQCAILQQLYSDFQALTTKEAGGS